MNVRFLYVEKSRLNEVQINDGQIIALTDEAGYYYDMGGQRYLVAASGGNASGIPYGVVAQASTARVLSSNIESIDIETLADGTCAYIINTVVNASGQVSLNVSNTGARPVYDAKSGSNTISYLRNTGALFIYNTSRAAGGCWDMITDKLVTNSSLGDIQAECTDTTTPASYYTVGDELVRDSDFELTDNALLSISFSVDVVGGKSLKVGSNNPYPMVYGGSSLIDGIIPAGSTALFRYDEHNHNYVLLSVDTLISDVRALQAETYKSGIFWCQYGVTTYNEIHRAIDSGSLCMLYYQNRIYQCIGQVSRNSYGFESLVSETDPTLWSTSCVMLDGWADIVQTELATKADVDAKYTKPENGIPLSDCDFDPAVVDPSFQNDGEAAGSVITGQRFTQLETITAEDVYTVVHADQLLFTNDAVFAVDTGGVWYMSIPTNQYVSQALQYYEDRLFTFGSADYEWSVWSYNTSALYPTSGVHPAGITGWVNASCPLLLKYNLSEDIYYRIAFRRVDGAQLDGTEMNWVCRTISIRSASKSGLPTPSSGSSFRTTRNDPELVKQIRTLAFTYYNNQQSLDYGNTTIFDTDTYTNKIDCSTFIGLLLRGLGYEDTWYSTHQDADPLSWKASPRYAWARDLQYYENIIGGTGSHPDEYYQTPHFIRTASQIAEWMVGMGWQVPMDEMLTNLEPGDIVFYQKKVYNSETGTYDWKEPGRFMNISHIGICVDKAYSYPSPPNWVTGAGGNTSGHYPNWVAEERYLRFPICHRMMDVTTPSGSAGCVQLHHVEYQYDNTDADVVTKTGYPTLCLICRPDLGSLSWPATYGTVTIESAFGNAGEIRYNENTLYICVQDNVWKAVSLRTIS